MSRFRIGVLGWMCLGSVSALPVTPVQAATISLACSGIGIEMELCREGAEQWGRESGHTVEVVVTPMSATEQLAFYQEILSTGADDIDVLQIDIVWPGLLREHFIDLEPFMLRAEQAHFPALVASGTVDGELKAMPWFADAGLLFYRTDLLEKYGRSVPTTWEELGETARLVMEGERADGNARMWGYAFQGRAYEGLVCNALEWIDGSGGGGIVATSGEITIDNAAAAAALDMAAGWVGTIAPNGVVDFAEEETRALFQSGDAVFMRNWPYAYALANAPASLVTGTVAVAPLPHGGAHERPTGTLDGQFLAVSRYSKNPRQAASLVRYLTSRVVQQRRAITGGFIPTVEALYSDPQVREVIPFLDTMEETFSNAVGRPAAATKDKYGLVSAATSDAVHRVLKGEASGSDAVKDLEQALRRIRQSDW